MLNDFTFVIWVPSFRCDEAHHMQMNIPNWIVISIHYHDILSKCVHSSLPILTTVSNNPNICKDLCLPGFLAWQSAHTLFPGTVFISSWRARSLRACWRLLTVADMTGCQSAPAVDPRILEGAETEENFHNYTIKLQEEGIQDNGKEFMSSCRGENYPSAWIPIRQGPEKGEV